MTSFRHVLLYVLTSLATYRQTQAVRVNGEEIEVLCAGAGKSIYVHTAKDNAIYLRIQGEEITFGDYIGGNDVLPASILNSYNYFIEHRNECYQLPEGKILNVYSDTKISFLKILFENRSLSKFESKEFEFDTVIFSPENYQTILLESLATKPSWLLSIQFYNHESSNPILLQGKLSLSDVNPHTDLLICHGVSQATLTMQKK